MSVQSIRGRLAGAARALLGVPSSEEAPGTASFDARILGETPVRAWPASGGTIRFYYQITNPKGATKDDFTMIAELPDGTQYDLRKRHLSVVIALPHIFWTSASVRLAFPKFYVDAAGKQHALHDLKIDLSYELHNGRETPVTLAGDQYFDTPTFSVAEDRGTYRTVRFYAYNSLDSSESLIREFDPLIILVPRRP
jgi:hypothetical protein